MIREPFLFAGVVILAASPAPPSSAPQLPILPLCQLNTNGRWQALPL